MGNLCKKKKKPIPEPHSTTKDQINFNSQSNILINSNKPSIVNNFIIQMPVKNDNNSFQQKNTSSVEKYGSLKKIDTNFTNPININYKTFIKGKNYSDLLNEYDILEHLGAGAFGVVQKVRHKASKQIRAMKTIKKNTIYEEKNLKEIDIRKVF